MEKQIIVNEKFNHLILPCLPHKHFYEEKICPKCGQDFCEECCYAVNRTGEDKFMLCPACGHNYYS